MTPRPKQIDIPTDKLKKLYVRKGLSVRDVAAALNVSKDTICRELERHGIERRRRSVPDIGKGVLKKLYVRDRLPIREIAEALKISKSALHRELARHGIPRRPQYVKRGRLSDIPLEILETNVATLGIRGAARSLGIPFSTLRETIARRREKRMKRG